MSNLKSNNVQDILKYMRVVCKEKNVYIWGAGTYGHVLGRFFNKYEINWKGYIDNDKKKQHTAMCDKIIYPFEEIEKKNIFVVISLSCLPHKNAIKEIKQKILLSGIEKECILILGDKVSVVDDMVFDINDGVESIKRNHILKDIYKGKRCFVIGNGPSLNIADLEKMMEDVTMACNGICELFDVTKWRPTCFFCEDNIFINEHIKTREELEVLLKDCKYAFTTIRSDLKEKYGFEYDNLFYLNPKRSIMEVEFSDNICECIYSAGTTLYSMLQVAVYMGIKEIYFIGVDFSFRKVVHEDGTVEEDKCINNHMELMNQVNQGLYAVDLITKGYLCVQKYAKEHDIKIYNATRGGKLEVFERVDFDSLF